MGLGTNYRVRYGNWTSSKTWNYRELFPNFPLFPALPLSQQKLGLEFQCAVL